jgi:DNA mismatch endonuclease, patch repair protein
MLRLLGYLGYRVHRKDLPGNPDIAFIGKRKAIFVHGCFWHGHSCRHGSNKPKSNRAYWLQKIERNKLRDKSNKRKFSQLGWSVLTIWECELHEKSKVLRSLNSFMKG